MASHRLSSSSTIRTRPCIRNPGVRAHNYTLLHEPGATRAEPASKHGYCKYHGLTCNARQFETNNEVPGTNQLARRGQTEAASQDAHHVLGCNPTNATFRKGGRAMSLGQPGPVGSEHER